MFSITIELYFKGKNLNTKFPKKNDDENDFKSNIIECVRMVLLCMGVQYDLIWT